MTERGTNEGIESTALLEACKQIEDTTGSCPSNMKDWEHPESCETHCERGCEVDCWKTYFISLSSNPNILSVINK